MSELKKQLDFLSSIHNDSEDNISIPENTVFIKPKTVDVSNIKSKKKKKKSIDDILDETDTFIDSLEDDDLGYDFETYIEDALNMEEDEELKTTLIGMGRKYARTHQDDKEDSEVTKAFAPQEKELNTLITELAKDAAAIESDIYKMRSSHQGINRKNLADMITAKTQIHNTTLSAIKEKNNIKKIKFDIINKKNAAKKDIDLSEDSLQNSQLLQSILNSTGLMDNYNREESSGAPMYDDYSDTSYIHSIDSNDEYIQKKYFNNEESETDKYIKYENEDVKYVLLYNEDTKEKKIIAENKDGDIIPDYPVPDKIDELNFSFDRDSSTAIDQLNRKYELRPY